MSVAKPNITIKRHDTRPSLRVRLIQKSDGEPVDLTGATALFYMKDSVGVLKVNGGAAAVEVPETDGYIRYDWAVGDTDTSDDYIAEFEVDYGGGAKLTVPSKGVIKIKVVEDLNDA